MNINNFKHFNLKKVFLLSATFLVWLTYSSTSSAQILDKFLTQKTSFPDAKKQVEPPRRGTPKTEAGTGSRGDCPYNPELPPFTSLVGNKALASATDKHPSFWVYIPYSAQEVTQGEFTLQDRDNDLYRGTVELPVSIPGIVEIKIPPDSAPLKLGREYRWYFEIDCSTLSRKSNSLATLTGVVSLVPPSDELSNELKAAQTSWEKGAVFVQHGIWHEALTQLVQLRSQKSKNFAQTKLWHQLLEQSDPNKVKIFQNFLAGEAEVNYVNLKK